MNGKKTYFVSFASILGALAGVVSGQLSVPDAAQIIVTAILGATIRHGVATKSDA